MSTLPEITQALAQAGVWIQHCPDSFAALAQLHSASVDVVITDPPYDAHCQENQTSGTAVRKLLNGEIHGHIPRVVPKFAPLEGYEHIPHLVRIAKRWALSFVTLEGFGECKRALEGAPELGEYVRSGVWIKSDAMGQVTADRPAAAMEGIAIMHSRTDPTWVTKSGKAKKVWNGRGSYAYWVCNSTRGEPGRHPNQKPLKLCIELVYKFSNAGEVVLDPFCGSGRIGEACILTGRRYAGWDSDPAWVAEAQARLARVLPFAGRLADRRVLNQCKFTRGALTALAAVETQEPQEMQEAA